MFSTTVGTSSFSSSKIELLQFVITRTACFLTRAEHWFTTDLLEATLYNVSGWSNIEEKDSATAKYGGVPLGSINEKTLNSIVKIFLRLNFLKNYQSNMKKTVFVQNQPHYPDVWKDCVQTINLTAMSKDPAVLHSTL